MISWQPGMSLEYLEKMAIKTALKFHHFNKAATARSLGIAPRTLDAKLEKYEYEDKEKVSTDAKQRESHAEFMHRSRNGRLAATAEVAPVDQRYNGGFTRTDSPTSKPAPSEAREQAVSNGVTEGARVEPAAGVTPESEMPMPQRKEVQSVPPKHSSQGSHNRRR